MELTMIKILLAIVEASKKTTRWGAIITLFAFLTGLIVSPLADKLEYREVRRIMKEEENSNYSNEELD